MMSVAKSDYQCEVEKSPLENPRTFGSMNKGGYIYIMSNKHHTTLYIGVTSDLEMRVMEHKAAKVKSFTQMYNLDELLYFEVFDSIADAIDRETQLKKWSRAKKDALIATLNPRLEDLSLKFRTELLLD
jgi:putative endonuclease